MSAIMFSTKSDMNSKVQEIGFSDDRHHLMMAKGRKDYDKGSCNILSLNEIAFIGKDIYLVTEGHQNFFLI